MNKMFLVMGAGGSFSTHYEFPVAVAETDADAEAIAETLNRATEDLAEKVKEIPRPYYNGPLIATDPNALAEYHKEFEAYEAKVDAALSTHPIHRYVQFGKPDLDATYWVEDITFVPEKVQP